MAKFRKVQPREEHNERVKLDRFLSREGVCTRSEAQKMAEENRILVNGEIVTDVMKRILPYEDSIEISDGSAGKKEEKVLVLLYKPKGIVSQLIKTKDRPACSLLKKSSHAEYVFGKQPLTDFVDKQRGQFLPMGGLEKEHYGLLGMTTDRLLIKKVNTNEFLMRREFLIEFDGELSRKKMDKIRSGVHMGEHFVKPAKVDQIDDKHLSMVLRSQIGNQVYSLLRKIGLKPVDVQCVRIGKFQIGSMKAGQWIVYDNPNELLVD